MKRKYLTTWLVVLSCVAFENLSAQVRQPFRFEQELKNSDLEVHVVSLEKEGLAVIRDREDYSHGKKSWQVEIIDTTLTSVWSCQLELDTRLALVGYEHTPGQLFLLFREQQTMNYKFQLLAMRFYDQFFQIDKISFDLSFRLTHFTVVGSNAIFGGYINSEAAVLLYDRTEDHPKVLPGLFSKGISLLDVRANQNQTFNVLLSENRGVDKNHLIVRTFDSAGNLLLDDVIKIDPKLTILSGFTSTLVRDEMIIAGTYGEGNNRLALGLYSVLVDPFKEQSIVLTDFSSMEHFLDYLPEKKAKRIKEKAQGQKAEGKQPSYRATVVPYRLEERGDGFYLLSEVYYSSTSFNSNPYYNPYWNSPGYGFNNPAGYGYPTRSTPSRNYNAPFLYDPYSRNVEVRMIETIVTRFGPHGKHEKDISMRLDDVKQSIVEQKSDFIIRKDSVIVGYKKKNELWFQEEPVEQGFAPSQKQEKIKLKQPTDILKDENDDGGGLRYWYDRHFYVWGYQRIKSTLEDEMKSRYVFYVNRIDL